MRASVENKAMTGKHETKKPAWQLSLVLILGGIFLIGVDLWRPQIVWGFARLYIMGGLSITLGVVFLLMGFRSRRSHTP